MKPMTITEDGDVIKHICPACMHERHTIAETLGDAERRTPGGCRTYGCVCYDSRKVVSK